MGSKSLQYFPNPISLDFIYDYTPQTRRKGNGRKKGNVAWNTVFTNNRDERGASRKEIKKESMGKEEKREKEMGRGRGM